MDTLNFKYIFRTISFKISSTFRYLILLIIFMKQSIITYPANKQLVGKIEKEHSLFYDGQDNQNDKHSFTKMYTMV